MATVFLVGTFLKSSVIANNDLGWRAWLPGQFILLIWGVDVLETWFVHPLPRETRPGENQRTRRFLATLLILGVVTSGMDLALLRLARTVYSQAGASERGYAARQAYEYIRDHVPADVITQNNPLDELDRPSGLYGSHQMIVSDRTGGYGVPLDAYKQLANGVGAIFTDESANWEALDALCRRYSIQVIILKDTDPTWKQMTALQRERPPLYANPFYSVFACGGYR